MVSACGGSTPQAHGEPLTSGLEAVLEQVAELRGLPAPDGVRAATVPRAGVRELLAGTLSDDDHASFQNLSALYRVMGLIGPNDDYETLYLDFAARAVIGFFEPAGDTLWLVNDSGSLDVDAFDPILRSTVAHELVHAVQNGRYPLPQLLRSAANDPDWSLALNAVIEGDAVHYERLWGAEHLAGKVALGPEIGVSGSGIPAALERELRFPYDSGLDWADLAGAKDDNAATNGALAGERITTAQVLHPELGTGWQPATVEQPDLSKQLGSGWNRASTGSFGEFRLRNFLQLRLAGLPAVAGAAGWSGDQYALYTNGDDSVVLLEVAFDLAENANEFADAMASWLELSGAHGGPEAVQTLADGRGISVRRKANNEVLLVFGSNAETAALALGAE